MGTSGIAQQCRSADIIAVRPRFQAKPCFFPETISDQEGQTGGQAAGGQKFVGVRLGSGRSSACSSAKRRSSSDDLPNGLTQSGAAVDKRCTDICEGDRAIAGQCANSLTGRAAVFRFIKCLD
jgi:hypothetical protein